MLLGHGTAQVGNADVPETSQAIVAQGDTWAPWECGEHVGTRLYGVV
jgi:hypothetical protein